MLEQFHGFPRARTLLPEASDPPSIGVSTGAGEPLLPAPESPETAPGGNLDPIALDRAVRDLEGLDQVEIAFRRHEPGRAGSVCPWPSWVSETVRDCYRAKGVEQPYAHQRDALDAIRAGDDIVLATPTASGKSLCFRVPILQSVLDDPSHKTLLLFPTKALARDQITGMRDLVGNEHPRMAFGAGTFDGDTPPDERRATRRGAHAIATNPDMLHRGIAPHHDTWARVLAGLRYVVLDEVHVYRGVFGSHVANVLRRLWRLCAHYGSRPQVIACSATIRNPGELVSRLIGRPVRALTHDTAPRGRRTWLMLNPKVVDPLTGVRRDYLKVTRAAANVLVRHRVKTLAFFRTRKAVELLTRYLQDDAAQIHGIERSAGEVRGYRGGYLPQRRRAVEGALREGEANFVASTNALELGMDIGGLDAVMLAGYPGTRASTWQRAGRAGRRGQPSLCVQVLSSRPTDQFVAAHPGFLFDEPPEEARIDPNNFEVLVPHLRCAAYELPIECASEATSEASHPPYPASGVAHRDGAPGASLAGSFQGLSEDEVRGLVSYLAESGSLHHEREGEGADAVDRYYSVGESFPADGVDLRGGLEENFTVLLDGYDSDDRPGRVLAEVDFEDAPLYLHPGAIYTIEGQTHEVRRLDWDERKAYVEPVRASYYTEAVANVRVRMLEPPALEAEAGVGMAHFVRAVPGFKKLRFDTHENIGFGPINLPDLERHTVAAFWRMPELACESLSDPVHRADAAMAAGHAIHHVAASFVMCDPADLGLVIGSGAADGNWAVPGQRRNTHLEVAAAGRPTIYLYDRAAGGVGLATGAYRASEAIFEGALRMLESCGCQRGCPTCVGPAVLAGAPGMLGAHDSIPQNSRGQRKPTPAVVGHAHPRLDAQVVLRALLGRSRE